MIKKIVTRLLNSTFGILVLLSLSPIIRFIYEIHKLFNKGVKHEI